MPRFATIDTVLIKSGTRFRVRWRETVNGLTREKNRTFKTFQEADALRTKLQVRIGLEKNGRSLVSELLKENGNILIALEEFAQHVQRGVGNDAFPNALKYMIGRMIKQFHWKYTGDITKKSLGDAADFLHNRPTLRYKTIDSIKRFLKFCRPLYAIDEAALGVKVPKPADPEILLWSNEQIKKILTELCRPQNFPHETGLKRYSTEWKAAISQRILYKSYPILLDLFRILILWAMRPKEACNLLVRHWDQQRRKIQIVKTKNRHNRTISVDKETAEIFNRLCHGKSRDDHIFKTTTGNTWRPGYMSQAFKALFTKLGIPGHLYCARHFAATNLIKQGPLTHSGVKTIMSITGHRTFKEFEKYVHLVDGEMEKIADSGYADAVHGIKRAPDSASPPDAMPNSNDPAQPRFKIQEEGDEDEQFQMA